MDFRLKRLDDIKKRLLNKVELLGEYEKKLDYEKDPSERKRFQDAIQKLKEEIEAVSDEAENISQSITKESDKDTQNYNPSSVNIRQQYYDEYIGRKRQEKN